MIRIKINGNEGIVDYDLDTNKASSSNHKNTSELNNNFLRVNGEGGLDHLSPGGAAHPRSITDLQSILDSEDDRSTAPEEIERINMEL